MKFFVQLKFSLVLALLVFGLPSAQAMIRGGEGNKPLPDPGWPLGAAKVFNTESRIAWWEDPPFGGGRWHSECQGDTEAFLELLADVTKIDSVPKRLIVRDGIGRSFWLDPNREKLGNKAFDMDWSITVWTHDGWNNQRRMPKELTSIRDPAGTSPVLEIELYIGGLVKWSDVVVPEGIEVVDNTLATHGYKLSDGVVLEGTVLDKATQLPLVATIELKSVDRGKGSGEKNATVQSLATDAKGNWVLRRIKAGFYQLDARCPGYAARRLSYLNITDDPSWQRIDGALSKSQIVEGSVVDAEGKPIAGATVWLMGTEYEGPDQLECNTDEDGHFYFAGVPGGTASIRCHKEGYCQIGLPSVINVPSEKGLRMSLVQAGSLLVFVDFNKPKPSDYMVHIADARGEKAGRWGGAGSIDTDCKIQFDNIPPGKYKIHGRPNPSSESELTKPIEVEVIGGKTIEVTIEAKE